MDAMWRLLIAGLLAVVVIACSGSTPGPTSTPAQTAVTAPTVVPVFTPAPPGLPGNTPTREKPTVVPTATSTQTAVPTPTLAPIPIMTVAPTGAPIPAVTPIPVATPTRPVSTPLPGPTVAVPEPGAATVLGRWEGINTVGPNELGFIVTCGDAIGGLECALDVPDQGLSGEVLSNVSFEAGRLHFEFETNFGTAVWDGQLRDDAIEGDFSQAGVSGTFRLERASLPAVPAGAPAPNGEMLYREEEVEFASGAITLAGTLTLPGSAGPYPAAVLVSGSGGQNRDEDVAGFPMFGIIADHLTSHGIAVLRYDDPGIGGSTGDVLQETIHDRTGNVLAAVGLLLRHAEIDPDRIGLIGHSEGGIVAPLAATRSDDVSFLVLLAGTGVPGDVILRAQLEFLLEDQGATAEEIQTARAQQQRLFSALTTGEGWEEVEQGTRRILLESIAAAPESERASITDIDAYVDIVIKQQLMTVQSPWYRSFFEYDPGPVLERLSVPVLALFGELDTQVPAETNAAAMVAALSAVDNPDFTLFVLPGANHLFQTAVTGSISEYSELEAEFVPGFLERIEEWVSMRTR